MENQILEILKRMEQRFDGLEQRFDGMEQSFKGINQRLDALEAGQLELRQDVKRIERKLDGVVEQTADLTEFRTEVKEQLQEIKEVKEVTKNNCYEISRLTTKIKV